MIYIVSENDKLKDYLAEVYYDEYIINLDSNETYSIVNHPENVLILDLHIFDSIHPILDFFHSLPENLKVMALRSTTNLAEGTLLVKKGIKSYCEFDLPRQALVEIYNIVRGGNSWVYPELMNYIIKQMSTTSTSSTNSLEKLTAKEQEVAMLVSSGNSNQQIADTLDVALVTVKKHIGSIFEKLGVKDRVSLSILVNKD